MKNKWNRVILIPILIIILCIGLFFPFYQVVAFEYENSGEILAYLPVKDGTHFDMKYIHSIHLSPVFESYFIKEGQIIQYQTTYEEYGIGMPANAEENEIFSEQDGKYVISGMNRAFSHVDLRVARVTVSQQIIVNEKNIDFTAFASPGTWVRMKVKNINKWRMLKGGSIYD